MTPDRYSRYVTPAPEVDDPRQRYGLYRLCECSACLGRGYPLYVEHRKVNRCPICRGEGRVREEVAACETPEAVGVALVTLAMEGEWEGCPFGLLDRDGEVGKKWLILPWLPSARNVSDAARVLAKSKTREEK